jgi:hypothetical protein
LCNGDETQKLWKPLLTQFSFSEAHRNALHNGLHTYSFSKSATQSPPRIPSLSTIEQADSYSICILCTPSRLTAR